MEKLIIPLNAFPQNELEENGQHSFIKPLHEKGVYGVEIRRELFRDKENDRIQTKKRLEETSLFIVYSAPIQLWLEDGSLNQHELRVVFEEGEELHAQWVKISLGFYQEEKSSLEELQHFLNNYPALQLFVENDQTSYGGNIKRLQKFFEEASKSHVQVAMTFDSGNWLYTNQSLLEAIKKLSSYVQYIHLKHVYSLNGKLVTVSILDDLYEKWKDILLAFPRSTIKALEFPIESIHHIDSLANHINSVTESEELV